MQRCFLFFFTFFRVFLSLYMPSFLEQSLGQKCEKYIGNTGRVSRSFILFVTHLESIQSESSKVSR